MDTRGFTGTTQLGKPGEAEDGAKYYKVIGIGGPGETDNIDGCYQKISFHSVHPEASDHKYPIYKQTGRALYLRINEEEKGAPWTLADEEKNIKYE